MQNTYTPASDEDRLSDLVGVLSREGFDDALDCAVNKALVHDAELAVAVVSVEGFRELQQRLGREHSEKLMRVLAVLLRNNLRGSDSLCRFQSDQFALLLRNTGAEGALETAEKLQRVIASRSFEDVQPDLIRVTLSVGLAYFQPDFSAAELMQQAVDQLNADQRPGQLSTLHYLATAQSR